MSETTTSHTQSPTNDLIGSYYISQWHHSSKSPQSQSQYEEQEEESPTALDTIKSSSGFAVVGPDKLSVSYPNLQLHSHDVGVVQANRPAPTKRLLYYFEIFVKNAGAKGQLSIGFTTSDFSGCRQPGWDPNTYGYHGVDGLLYRGHDKGETFGPTYTTGDTVGGGINYATQEFFFTKNGVLVGSVYKDVKGPVYPTVAVHSQYEEYVQSRNIFLSILLSIPCFLCIHGTPPLLWVHVNFGQDPFVFDIKAYEAEQRAKQQMAIDDISIPQDTSYALVRSYLQHYGYEATLDSLDIAGRSMIPPISLTQENGFNEEESSYALNHRRTLRQLIRCGDIDAALSKLEEWYPQIVKDVNSPVCFLLHCQKFIELVRNGKLEEAVLHGRDEFIKFKALSEFELVKDCATLLAYEQPGKSSVGYLLQESQRELLADAVNAKILSTDPNIKDGTLYMHSRLERLIRQLTACFLEKRSLNDNQGEAFHLHRFLNSGQKG